MNPVIVPVRTGLAMTRRCIQSLLTMDIPIDLMVADNGSDCGAYLRSLPNLNLLTYQRPMNLHLLWNSMLEVSFEHGAQYALVVNNDTVLSPWTYRILLEDGGQFVTAVSSDLLLHPPPKKPLSKRPHPDFSCFLIRKECYEQVGPFDERFNIYCGDLDYHLRMHEAGIEAVSLSLPFYHERSSTLRLLPEHEAKEVCEQADRDRQRFEDKWKCGVGSMEYYEKFKESLSHTTDL